MQGRARAGTPTGKLLNSIEMEFGVAAPILVVLAVVLSAPGAWGTVGSADGRLGAGAARAPPAISLGNTKLRRANYSRTTSAPNAWGSRQTRRG